MTTTLSSPADVIGTVDTRLVIGGRRTEASDGARFDVLDPATGEVLAAVADATPQDGRAAVVAAVAAQAGWAAVPARKRGEILRRAHEALLADTERLATIMTLEMGKSLTEARGEVRYAAEFFRWFAEEAVRLEGWYGHTPDGASRAIVASQPVGPCLLITPWNFPLAMGTRKIGPALAAGCTVVLKPAPQTPLSSLALADVLAASGVPEGVVSVLPGSRAAEVVEPLLRGGDIRKLSFTGSTAVGRILLEQASTAIVRTSLELGGNAPFVVLADADLDEAVDGAMAAKMRNMGEACTAANRMFVHRSLAAEFGRRLAERMGALRVGNGLDEGTEVGPLIDAPSLAKVGSLVDDAVSRGAQVLVGGAPAEGPGYFYPPTVLTDVAPDSALCATEIFGPVAAIQVFDDVDDAIARANATEWGLVGYVFTRDVDRALAVSEALEVGMVGLNVGVVSNPALPFGGVKQSGLGREGGRHGIAEFLEQKLVVLPKRG
ncbi:NAD-dependent succinate-semialdehyde dehydrogenase [Pseudonocardia halophobica]|uniref:NAD-dependent succinate-semialdehyde dehydrogenase n=1 Tax=Pseudonocardia halophobica TaxID=29401 RepID=A0A9W6NYP8_9PSEU|nr:NAD-dependent succinate-semialdehyde dehydrogenase [Pseudonocardia halophobica]GLL14023.1 NAD-dependent succinate-semialdehyde dehydrogenase [Pseudonocardia halophobica]